MNRGEWQAANAGMMTGNGAPRSEAASTRTDLRREIAAARKARAEESAPEKMRVPKPLRKKIVGGECYTVKRIDNSRLVRHIEPVKLRALYKTVALMAVMAVFCTLYIYQHFRCIDLSFQLEDLKNKQEQAASLNSELRLEKSALRDPHRIDVIAQHQLGLKRPEPTQVREYTNFDGAQVASAQFVKANRLP